MKIRKQEYGTANMVGKNIEQLRKERDIKQKDFIAKMQVLGCDINPTSYSKLEGQVRSATDREIYVISKILGVKMEELFNEETNIECRAGACSRRFIYQSLLAGRSKPYPTKDFLMPKKCGRKMNGAELFSLEPVAIKQKM